MPQKNKPRPPKEKDRSDRVWEHSDGTPLNVRRTTSRKPYTKELEVKDEYVQTGPGPAQRSNRTQVTPGKWNTK